MDPTDHAQCQERDHDDEREGTQDTLRIHHVRAFSGTKDGLPIRRARRSEIPI